MPESNLRDPCSSQSPGISGYLHQKRELSIDAYADYKLYWLMARLCCGKSLSADRFQHSPHQGCALQTTHHGPSLFLLLGHMADCDYMTLYVSICVLSIYRPNRDPMDAWSSFPRRAGLSHMVVQPYQDHNQYPPQPSHTEDHHHNGPL